MKHLHYLNLIGVLSVAALCVVQWQMNRRLNLELSSLEKTRLDHEARIAEQDRTSKGLSSDLEGFRERFTRADTEAKEAGRKLADSELRMNQLERERDQLRESVTNWAGAVTMRDEQIKEANGRIRELADDLNGAIRKFNELATNHNAAVNDLNTRTRDYNALLEKYNATVKPSAGSASQ
jgi:chromosome segregation ATPase